MPVFLEYAIALGTIVVAASFFTNAIEILGGRLSLGHEAVGSVLAAVGTALPEIIIPVVAILAAVFAGRDPETAGEIGIGAILGAPFMLATLAAMFVVGASALTFRNRRAKGSEIRCREVAADEFPWCKAPGKSVNIDADTIARDIAFFLLFFAVAAAVGVLELLYPLKVTLALLLIVAYALYVRRTLHSGAALRGGVGEAHAVAPELRAAVVDRRRPGVACARAHSGGGPDLRGRRRTHRRGRRASCGPRRARVGPSGHRAAGEDQFRHLGEGRQGHFGPRQHNGRDGLPEHRPRFTFGVLFTRWELEPLNLFSVVLALISGGFVYVVLRRRKTIRSWQLMVGGRFYLVFLVGAVFAVL